MELVVKHVAPTNNVAQVLASTLRPAQVIVAHAEQLAPRAIPVVQEPVPTPRLTASTVELVAQGATPTNRAVEAVASTFRKTANTVALATTLTSQEKPANKEPVSNFTGPHSAPDHPLPSS